MPIISVIVPVYKVENLLRRCVDSILNQTFEDFELILVDDGSPDNSGDICEKYSLADNRVRVIHKQNGGLSSARNAGIDIAEGKYLCFVDSDDMVHPQMLQLLFESLVANRADLISTRHITFYSEDVVFEQITQVRESILERKEFLQELYPDNFEKIGISAWGKLYKRELFEEIRYPEGRIYEDLHIYLKLLCQCKKIVVLDQPMYYYYMGNVSITKSDYAAYCRFDEFIVRLGHAVFFDKENMLQQYEYAINDYLTFYLRNAFAVLLKYKEKKKEFIPYMRENRKMLSRILCNSKVCRARKICTVLIHISPAMARIIAKRCIPECLLEEMR